MKLITKKNDTMNYKNESDENSDKENIENSDDGAVEILAFLRLECSSSFRALLL